MLCSSRVQSNYHNWEVIPKIENQSMPLGRSSCREPLLNRAGETMETSPYWHACTPPESTHPLIIQLNIKEASRFGIWGPLSTIRLKMSHAGQQCGCQFVAQQYQKRAWQTLWIHLGLNRVSLRYMDVTDYCWERQAWLGWECVGNFQTEHCHCHSCFSRVLQRVRCPPASTSSGSAWDGLACYQPECNWQVAGWAKCPFLSQTLQVS